MALTVNDIGELLRLVEASSFEEVEIELEGARIVTRRSGASAVAVASQVRSTTSGVASATTDPAAIADAVPGARVIPPVSASARVVPEPMAPLPRRSRPMSGSPQPDMAAGLVAVRAPMVGTFFRRPAPDQPPLVEIGQRVEAGQPLCLIEVMKLFATVEAPAAGIVEAVLAEDTTLVEFDQPLFAIRTIQGSGG